MGGQNVGPLVIDGLDLGFDLREMLLAWRLSGANVRVLLRLSAAV
jgi:hypothetical protein